MRFYISLLSLLFAIAAFGQQKKKIRYMVPNQQVLTEKTYKPEFDVRKVLF